MKKLFSSWKQDLPSSIVVFLVALPLCLGIGLASTNIEGIKGIPNIFSGLISGIVGGIVVGAISKSKIGVSGPAAGLITIVVASIVTLGSYEAFLTAVVLAGVLQLTAGFAGLGSLGNYFPSTVIKGMLAAIGITLILKEIPHALGYDKDFFGDESFFQMDGHNTFSELAYAFNSLTLGSIVISLVSMAILIIFELPRIKKIAIFKFIPPALIVVVFGIIFNAVCHWLNSSLYVGEKHLVAIPVSDSFQSFLGQFSSPNWTFLTNPQVYIIALTVALVGSLETLLSVEATDRIDPEKNLTPTNHELKAQGIGNILSGLIGGLPITQVIVRSSANVNSGGKSKLSTIIHGFLLLICVYFIPDLLNKIPLASLAAILIMVGYKLSKIELYTSTYRLGIDQFLPFVTTVLGVIFTDLLKGIGIGLLVAIFFILRRNYKRSFSVMDGEDENVKVLKLQEHVTYLNKGSIHALLEEIPSNSTLIIDMSKCKYIDFDVTEMINDFELFTAKKKNIIVTKTN